VSPLAAAAVTALAVAAIELAALLALARAEERGRSADRRPIAAAPRTWFEALDVGAPADRLCAILASNDRLLVLRITGDPYELNAMRYRVATPAWRRNAERQRDRVDAEIAAAGGPDGLFGHHPKDFAIPLAEVGAVHLRRRPWWRQLWAGPAELAIEARGAAPVRLVIEYSEQLAAAVRVLSPVLGGSLHVDPALARVLREPETAIRRAVGRYVLAGPAVLAVMCLATAAALGAVPRFEPRGAREALSARIVSCRTEYPPKSAPIARIRLDQPPGELRWAYGGDERRTLDEACLTGADVNVIYDWSPRSSTAWVFAMWFRDGRAILSEEDAWRAEARREATSAAVAAGAAVTGLVFLGWGLRWRRRALRGDPLAY
jgi:hypothetical protein